MHTPRAMSHAAPPAVLRVSVVVPVYQSASTLTECLQAISTSSLNTNVRELIVVDDSSSDGSAAIANEHADVVLHVVGGPRGPAHARNLGAQQARGDVLVFVDADVVVSHTALAQLDELFTRDRELTAAFGAYDTSPRDPGVVSQYRNLLHHFVHTKHPGEAVTFWSGLGAVRRQTFLEVGGFDANRFPRPLCEDIEFGYRLTDRGHRMLLVPEVQGTHLKRWTLGGMLRTDLYARAIPWMHLLLERRGQRASRALNVNAVDMWLTALAGVACAAALLTVMLGDARWLWLVLFCIVCMVVGNAPLLRWFAGIRGAAFAVYAAALRVLFYVVSGLGAAIALLTHHRQPAWPAPASLMESTDHATA